MKTTKEAGGWTPCGAVGRLFGRAHYHKLFPRTREAWFRGVEFGRLTSVVQGI